MDRGRHKIICIGNRHIKGDDIGPRVYDNLCKYPASHSIEYVDGGLGGLNLLNQLDSTQHVLFVDTVYGFTTPGGSILLDIERIVACSTSSYDHSAGLPYLLKLLPNVYEGEIPKISILGFEGYGLDTTLDETSQVDDKTIDHLCKESLNIMLAQINGGQQ